MAVENAWNPGLQSQLPRELSHLSTLFAAGNSYTTVEQVRELQDLTGMALEDLVVFHPQRLAVHELLIRVTADLSVPDGPDQGDLGIEVRRIAGLIHERYLSPRLPEISERYAALHARLRERLGAELDATLFGMSSAHTAPKSELNRGLFGWLSRTPVAKPAPQKTMEERERSYLERWRRGAERTDDEDEREAFIALVRVATAIQGRRGRILGDRDLLISLAAGLAMNVCGSRDIGRVLDEVLDQAILGEALPRLPAQSSPIVMNTKGASASGKSTMRPLQRLLAEEIGADWSEFAFISPDIWRKYLLDYSSLGEHYKYAGTCTGNELRVVDQKLDRYMAEKARRGGMTHLLIDRFRFDSFASGSDEEGSNLLTRFGDLIYMFFMITPPAETVERAWKRGLHFGRFKAVDDLLHHNVEAYTGMPQLFFTWALRAGKRVHYEFLDNDVPLNERPRTVACGWNGEMNVLDIERMLDVERFRKVNIDARSAAEVFPDAQALAADRNLAFLEQCTSRLQAVNFVRRSDRRPYARFEHGRAVWIDAQGLAHAGELVRTAITRLDPEGAGVAAGSAGRAAAVRSVAAESGQSVGRWD